MCFERILEYRFLLILRVTVSPIRPKLNFCMKMKKAAPNAHASIKRQKKSAFSLTFSKELGGEESPKRRFASIMLNMGITVPNKRLKISPIGTSQQGSDKLRILLKGLICAFFIASSRSMAFSSSILSHFNFISSSSLEVSWSLAIVD
jgi:hypothetical protein